jgi:peptide-methionine (S)-S-oxide reductase
MKSLLFRYKQSKFVAIALGILANCHIACTQTTEKTTTTKKYTMDTTKTTQQIATVGAGCFWCVEAQFLMLKGVVSVTSGYSGGSIKNPSYKEVCNGNTGHAEVCQIVFDTALISYDELLAAFWQTHDPTQLNRQGNDIGTQYRSVIFYHSDEQKKIAEKYKTALNQSGAYEQTVVTEISPFSVFYKAEDYHQNYFAENGNEPYCRFVVQPKVEKFKKVFAGKIK